MDIETTNAENTIAMIEKCLYLNMEDPTPAIKKQYAKVKKAIIDLHTELDTLNDMKYKVKD